MTAASTTATRWRVFSAAPHRMLFFAGALQAVLVMALWLAELGGRATGGWLLPWTQPATWVHAFLMLYGVFPFFIFGFLLTVYPRWMAGPAVPPSRYVPIFAALVSGMLLFYLGLFTARGLALAGVVAYLAGWLLAGHALFGVYRQARNRGAHERLLNAALTAGAIGLAWFAHSLIAGHPRSFAIARDIGLWLFLLPVLFTVSHRMIPFFSSSALAHYAPVRPGWSLAVFGLGSVGHFAVELAGAPEWRFVFDLPTAISALYLSIAWNLKRSFEVPLLAMLHVAFLWFGLGMALYGAQSLLHVAGAGDWLGRAPLHALGIGFVATMMIAMASRVTLGHSGRTLAADALTWACFLGMNATAMLRIAAELAPAATTALNTLTAGAWLACLLPWAWRYLPIYLRPRLDGTPG